MIDARFPRHFLLCWLGVLFILLLRSWQDIVFPAALYEDRTNLLTIFANNQSLADIFFVYNGYAAITSQTIAWVMSFLPVNWIPYAYAIASLLICSLAFSLFSLPQYSFLCSNAWHRVAVCLLLAILPLSRSLLVSNLTYSQFNSVFILLMLVASARHRQRNPVIDWLVIPLCIGSYPGSITLLPLYLVQMIYGTRSDRLQHGSYFLLTLAYIALLVDTSKTELLSFDYVFFRSFLGGSAIAGKVFVEPWIGASVSAGLFSEHGYLDPGFSYMRYTGFTGIFIVVCSIAAFTYHFFRREEKETTAYLILLTGFAIMLMSVFSRLTGMGWHAHLLEPGMQAYASAPRMCLLVFSGCFFAAAIQRWHVSALVSCPLVAIIFLAACYANIGNAKLYEPALQDSERLMQFLGRVQDEIDRGNHACKVEGDCIRTMDPDERWPIKLDLSRF